MPCIESRETQAQKSNQSKSAAEKLEALLSHYGTEAAKRGDGSRIAAGHAPRFQPGLSARSRPRSARGPRSVPRRAGRGHHNRQPPVFVTGYLNVRCQSPRTSYAAAGAPRIMGTAAGPRRAPRREPPTCSFVRPPPRPAARYYPRTDTRTPDGRPAPGFGRHRANKTRGDPRPPARSPRVPARSHGDASPKPPQLWARGPAAAAARSHRVSGAGTAPGATRPRSEGRTSR